MVISKAGRNACWVTHINDADTQFDVVGRGGTIFSGEVVGLQHIGRPPALHRELRKGKICKLGNQPWCQAQQRARELTRILSLIRLLIYPRNSTSSFPPSFLSSSRTESTHATSTSPLAAATSVVLTVDLALSMPSIPSSSAFPAGRAVLPDPPVRVSSSAVTSFR
jgi:hypothetical protein